MTDVCVVFGSKSDEKVYSELLEKLKIMGVSYEFHVFSAHKTPRELEAALNNTNASIYIAGAGLSAALPGVIASKTIKPVIGLPCKGAFGGLDAFLSCSQMPPDVPVLSVGVENIAPVISVSGHYLHGYTEIILVEKKTGEEKKYYEKCKKFMSDNNIPFSTAKNSNKSSYHAVFIEFTKLGKKVPSNNNTILNVLVKENSSEKDALKFFSSLKWGLCVGLNNYKNAAIIALELVNLKGNYNNMIVGLRKKAAQKVLGANK